MLENYNAMWVSLLKDHSLIWIESFNISSISKIVKRDVIEEFEMTL